MASGAEAVVIQLHPATTCFTCQHAQFGGPLTHCTIFGELILDERSAASDCEAYEEQERR